MVAKGGALPDRSSGMHAPRCPVRAGLGTVTETEVFVVPENKDLKRLVRKRMSATGERYTDALAHIVSQIELEPLPPGWVLLGTRAGDYEVGLLPADLNHEDAPVVRL